MTLMGYPLVELFLYFVFYSFLGWLMETCYCSIRERRLVPRGFLLGPVCPIYGTGVVLMILFFTPLKGNLPLFYVVAVVVMSSWEYFVAWVLETTTHVKYWDYSNERFNLKGRVCLWVSLVWGVLSYLVIFWIHPPVERLYERLPAFVVQPLALVLLAVLLADAAVTIHRLALVSALVVRATAAGEELQVQLALGKAELSDKLEPKAAALRQRYDAELARLEQAGRRFFNRYSHLTVSRRYSLRMEDLLAAAAKAKAELLARKKA